MKNCKYEYVVINKQHNEVEDVCSNREDARNVKRWLKNDWGDDSKIIQRVYKLETEKEVR